MLVIYILSNLAVITAAIPVFPVPQPLLPGAAIRARNIAPTVHSNKLPIMCDDALASSPTPSSQQPPLPGATIDARSDKINITCDTVPVASSAPSPKYRFPCELRWPQGGWRFE
ncbi:hypothetical protein FB567DRAFT_544438 [Paraphoma chrysanthemicola]|uniref:Uncharacterized protein n=1 Tax=Paraphoma chrysanthemicola TaxID=798071 RepID=A0A8K0RHP3_9PLEO|nr:hypothetical protein FB567DRAFT_544438 [Paraphoma chrysanthemicola]